MGKTTRGATARVWLLAVAGSAAMLATTWAMIRAHPNVAADTSAPAAPIVLNDDDDAPGAPAPQAPVHSRTRAS